jgi:hypothetical protein
MSKTTTAPRSPRIPAVVIKDGIALFPHVNTPDTTFDEAGVYSIDVVLPKEDAAEYIAHFGRILRDNYKAFCVQNKKKELKSAAFPWKDDTDSEGKPTGAVRFRCKSKASYVNKRGEKRTRVIPIFDRQGSVLPQDAVVGTGSRVSVNVEPSLFYTTLAGYGLTLRLYAVQVLELKSAGAGTADSYGFSKEVPESAQDAPGISQEAPAETASEGAFDADFA